MAVGSCNNPGLFNETGAPHHCQDAPCLIGIAGTDHNDCCPVPEIATIAMVGLGLVGLVGYIRVSGRRKD